jgi:hypothetical protein
MLEKKSDRLRTALIAAMFILLVLVLGLMVVAVARLFLDKG